MSRASLDRNTAALVFAAPGREPRWNAEALRRNLPRDRADSIPWRAWAERDDTPTDEGREANSGGSDPDRLADPGHRSPPTIREPHPSGHRRRIAPVTMEPSNAAPKWMARALLFAATCDIVAGGFVVLWPAAPLSSGGLEPPALPEIWQCLGLLIALFGLGYGLAARQPRHHWPVVLVGLLAKILISAGFVWAASRGRLPWELGLPVLVLGPLWWIPFSLILRDAARSHRTEQTPPALPLDMALSLYRDDEGTDLLEASATEPQFLVFLRHFGCTFCREALADLAAIRDRLRAAGTRPVLVHMSPEHEARELFNRYGLDDVVGISDPDRVLYRAFALRRGSPTQLFGWSVWKRGWEAGVKQGHGVGWLRGDAAQMPGAFVVSRGHVVAQFVHESAADRPDYVVVAEEGADQAEFQASLEDEGIGFGFQDRLRQVLATEVRGRG